MFTAQEIALLRKIGLDLDFEHPETLSGDDWVHVSDVVEDRYTLQELDENYEPTPDGTVCENILEKLSRKRPS